jgi:hypothetical protein
VATLAVRLDEELAAGHNIRILLGGR